MARLPRPADAATTARLTPAPSDAGSSTAAGPCGIRRVGASGSSTSRARSTRSASQQPVAFACATASRRAALALLGALTAVAAGVRRRRGFPLSFAASGSRRDGSPSPWALARLPLALASPHALSRWRAWRDAPLFPTPTGALRGLADARSAAAARRDAVRDAWQPRPRCRPGRAAPRKYPGVWPRPGVEWSWPLRRRTCALALPLRAHSPAAATLWAARLVAVRAGVSVPAPGEHGARAAAEGGARAAALVRGSRKPGFEIATAEPDRCLKKRRSKRLATPGTPFRPHAADAQLPPEWARLPGGFFFARSSFAFRLRFCPVPRLV